MGRVLSLFLGLANGLSPLSTFAFGALTFRVMKTSTTDILIIGGGPAGSLAALALADAGFSCVLAEKFPLKVQKEASFDGRTTALAYAGQRLLDRLGLWDALEPDAGPIHDIIVTDGRPKDRFRQGGAAPGFLHFDSRLLNDGNEAQAMGWIVENRHMRSVFLEAVENHKLIRVKAPSAWQDTKIEGARNLVRFEDGETIGASLVLAADGRPSPMRDYAGIRKTKWSYDQSGIVCTIKCEKDHQNIAQEYFLPGGPFAVLPLPHQRANLVWTEKTPQAKALMALPKPALMNFLHDRFGDYLGALSFEGPIWSYPLSFHIAEKFYADRLALIGDAAHGVHPIAGQGFNLAIKDIAALRDVLSEAALTGLDIGHGSVLERYQSWRNFDTAALAFGMDGLCRLFSNDFEPLRMVRSTGLGLVNKSPALRKFFMRLAGNDMGDLPSLMRA